MSIGLMAFTIFHSALSLVGILAGFVVVYGMLTGKRLAHWTAVFLATTVATSVTGFLFPVHHFMPSHAFGILSLLVLSVGIFALYTRHLNGHWRWIYVISAMIALYLNVFVLIVQAFLKVPALKAMAPTQAEPPFKVTQLVVLVVFVVLGVVAAMRFHTVQTPSSIVSPGAIAPG